MKHPYQAYQLIQARTYTVAARWSEQNIGSMKLTFLPAHTRMWHIATAEAFPLWKCQIKKSILSSFEKFDSQEAWRYGLTSSAEAEWLINLQALQEYKRVQGHVHVGFSTEDEADLASFARMQRAAAKNGSLSIERYTSDWACQPLRRSVSIVYILESSYERFLAPVYDT